MSQATTTRSRSRGLDTVLTAFAQIATMLGAALIGVLIGRRFGSTAETDGFFAANSIYGVSLFVAQSLRTTTAAPLVDSAPGFARFGRYLGGVVWVIAASLVLAVAAAVLAGLAGIEPDARSSFEFAVLILAVAAALQLFTGLAAAMLAALDDYMAAALAYVIGSLTAIVGVIALTPALGVNGVATATAIGASASAATVAFALAKRGWRPAPPPVNGHSLRTAGQLLLGAISLVAAQLVLVVSVAFAGATGTGNATLYSYSMMAIMLLTAALASPVSIVFAPIVARTWDRKPASLVPMTIGAFRAGALLTGPAVAVLVLCGPQPAGYALSSVSGADINRIFDLILVLSPSLLGTILVMIPLVAVFARRRFTALAAWSGVVVAGHTAALGAAVAMGGSLMAVAAVTTVSSIGLIAVPLALIFGRGAGAVLALAARAIAAFVLPAAAAFGLAALAVGFDRSLARGAAALLIGGIVYGAWLRVRYADEVSGLVRAIRPQRV